MKVICSILVSTLLMFFVHSPSADTKGWRGIVPLQSTRAEVESQFGEGTNECKCSYYRDDINVFFVYASGDCESDGSGDWNITKDTVIRFTIYPKVREQLSELEIDERKFEKRADIGDRLIYVNREEGMSFSVDGNKVVDSFSYGPSEKDESRRCPGYDGISYSSSLPKELRPRLLQKLNEFVQCSVAGNYEKQYSLYEPNFRAKWFGVKTARAFAELVHQSPEAVESLIEFKPVSISEEDDKTYGKVYEVYGITKEIVSKQVVAGHRQTRLILRDGEFYFIDQFRTLPM